MSLPIVERRCATVNKSELLRLQLVAIKEMQRLNAAKLKKLTRRKP